MPYSCGLMYELVNDVEAYPLFVNGCVGARILKHEQGVMKARLDLAKKGLKLSLTTRNTLDPPKLITMALVEGPFKRFEGRWFFQSLSEDACKVIVDIHFETESRAVGVAAKKFYETVSGSLLDEMCQRAHALYGK